MNGDFTWKYFTVDAIVGLSSFWYKQDDLDSWTRGGLSVPGFYSLNASVERPVLLGDKGEGFVQYIWKSWFVLEERNLCGFDGS